MFSFTAYATDCSEAPTPGCAEAWIPFQIPMTFVLPTSPPCTVTTIVHGRKKCNKYIEFVDLDWSFTFDPNHCYHSLNPDTRNRMIYAAIRENLAITMASQNPSLYPCPDDFARFEFRQASCWRLITIYYIPNPIGGGHSGPFELPWGTETVEVHLQTLQSLGADMNTLSASLGYCSGSTCCIREVKVCFLLDGTPVVTQMSGYTPLQTCPVGADLSCRINTCD